MNSGTSLDSSYKFISVTPSDTAILTYNGEPARCKAIYIGVSGDLCVKNTLGDAVIFPAVAAGSLYPIDTDMILASDTSADGIIALF